MVKSGKLIIYRWKNEPFTFGKWMIYVWEFDHLYADHFSLRTTKMLYEPYDVTDGFITHGPPFISDCSVLRCRLLQYLLYRNVYASHYHYVCGVWRRWADVPN